MCLCVSAGRSEYKHEGVFVCFACMCDYLCACACVCVSEQCSFFPLSQEVHQLIAALWGYVFVRDYWY